MTLTVTRVWSPSAKEWDDAWCNCPYSTYFHSREWAEIWEEYTCGRMTPDPLGVELSDSTQIILPFSKEKILKGLATRHVSSPAGTFGGWLANFSLNELQQTSLMQLIGKHYPNLIWRYNPYEATLYKGRLGSLTEDETQVLDLSLGFEKIHHDWTKGHASAARKARKAGVVISLAENIEDWENYFLVYMDSLNRWGGKATSQYSWNLFEAIFLKVSSNIRLWLAKHDGTVIAGALCFYSTTHVVYWHGAALSSYFELRPVNLLMYETISDACKRGCRWFDFNPSGGHKGVKAFKQSFGAYSKSANQVLITSAILKAHSRVLKVCRHLK